MKTIIRLLLAVVAMFFCDVSVAGEPTGNSTVKTSGKIIILHKEIPSRRPNAPSKIFIECHYDNESAFFTFPEGVESISILISNESDNWYGNATVAEPEIFFPAKSGDYDIKCTTDDGRIFYGQLSFD